MLSIDPAVVDDLKAEWAYGYDVIDFVDSNQYYTNAAQDIWISGNRYISIPLEIQLNPNTAGLNVDTVNMRISNAKAWFTSLFLNQDRQGETVILKKYTDSPPPGGTVTPYLRAFIEAWNLVGNTATITFTTEFALWKKKTMRYGSPSCAWAFKSAECGYVGSETWCDRSRTRCKALGNYDNFGGRKFISSIETKKIYWGPEGT